MSLSAHQQEPSCQILLCLLEKCFVNDSKEDFVTVWKTLHPVFFQYRKGVLEEHVPCLGQFGMPLLVSLRRLFLTAGPAASHIWCVHLEKYLLTPPSRSLFKCHFLYTFIVHCTVVCLIKLYWFKSTSSSVSVVFLTEFVLDQICIVFPL